MSGVFSYQEKYEEIWLVYTCECGEVAKYAWAFRKPGLRFTCQNCDKEHILTEEEIKQVESVTLPA